MERAQSPPQSDFSDLRASPNEGFDARTFLLSDDELYVPATQEPTSYQQQRSQSEEYLSPEPANTRNATQITHNDNEPIDDTNADEHPPQNMPAPVTKNNETSAGSGGKSMFKSDTITNSNSADSILGQDFTRFDQLRLMTEFEDDTRLQEEFEAEFNKRMLDLMLEFRVWAECRPTHERDIHGEQLVKEMEEIEAREVVQEQTRQNLVNFLSSIRSALSALTRG